MNAVLERKYESLRDTFVEQIKPRISDTQLNELKNAYSDVIDSKRTLSYIKDLNGLIRILETRRALGSDRIEPLEDMHRRFDHDTETRDMLKEYKEYSTQYLPMDLYNMYKFADVLETTSTSDQQSTQYQERTGNFRHVTQIPTTAQEQVVQREAQLKRNILRQVSEQLGRSWRDVARNLNARESQIEAIETKYPTDLKEQGYEALKISLDISNKKWAAHLQRALEMARRKDLRELVEKLLEDNE